MLEYNIYYYVLYFVMLRLMKIFFGEISRNWRELYILAAEPGPFIIDSINDVSVK